MIYHYYGILPESYSLSHWGVKGMHWGIRRAVRKGNNKKLSKYYNKAAKKLAKYEDMAEHSTKYGLKSAKYGIGAAGTAALAITGRKGAGTAIRGGGKILQGIGNLGAMAGNAAQASNNKYLKATGAVANKVSGKITAAGNTLYTAGDTVEKSDKWDAKHNLGDSVKRNLSSLGYTNKGEQAEAALKKVGLGTTVNNEALFRLGTGLVAAGLGAKAIQNAYRAGHKEKYAEKAAKQRDKMDRAFANTIYEGEYSYKKKRR